jgi:hypothetical protein
MAKFRPSHQAKRMIYSFDKNNSFFPASDSKAACLFSCKCGRKETGIKQGINGQND